MDLSSAISKIESLIQENTDSSITYAALECRLAIERICYERLRLAHDYISHDDIRKWQPGDVVKVLIQEVDANSAQTFSLSISKDPVNGDRREPTREDYDAMDFVEIGKQIGFKPNKLGKLWNALSKLALHTNVPLSKTDHVGQYGAKDEVKEKVLESLEEIRRIGAGSLLSSGFGKEVSFICHCGTTNKRRLELLSDGKVIGCINHECNESYDFIERDISFGRRVFSVSCRSCGTNHDIPKRTVEKLPTDKHIFFKCDVCSDTIYVAWKPMQTQLKPTAAT